MDTDSRYNLNRLAYFVAIVEEKTITAAAQRLGLSKAVVSKQLQLLEEEVQTNLLVRNTRHMHATAAGEAFYSRSKEVLKQAQHAYEVLAENSKEPSGLIRITSPIDFGVFRLSAFVAKFCRNYPKIDVELNMSDEIVDIVAQRYDLSFRIGWLRDSSNRARKIGQFRELAVSSVQTAARYSPRSPQALKHVPFVAFSGIDNSARVFTQRELKADQRKQKGKSEQRVEVQFDANLSVNVTAALREAILHGDYFGILPDFTIQKDLAEHRLVELLPEWHLREGGIYLVSPPSKLRTQALQLFIDAVVQEFQYS